MTIGDILKERWQEVRDAILNRHGDKIAEHDLDKVAGQRDELCHLIGAKCGMSQAQARHELDGILNSIEYGKGS